MSSTPAIEQQRTEDPKAVPLPIQIDPRYATPVYGTAEPTSGVPEQLRRRAYGYPAYDTRRWLLLLAADRAEVAGIQLGEAVIPGRQGLLARRYARLARAHPEGVIAFALGGLGIALAVLARRSR